MALALGKVCAMSTHEAQCRIAADGYRGRRGRGEFYVSLFEEGGVDVAAPGARDEVAACKASVSRSPMS
jgi:hypothetical protein